MRFIISPFFAVIIALFSFTTNALTQTPEWHTFSSPDSDYTIKFPAPPKSMSRTVNSEVGELLMKIFMYEAIDREREDNLLYGVSSTEYPSAAFVDISEESLKEFFRSSVDGAVSSVHGKLLTETIIKLNEYPGREIRVDFRDGLAIIKMRFILVKNKMYMIQTITETKKDFNLSINRFMNSFQLE